MHSDDSLPPDVAAWIERHAVMLRDVLHEPMTRARILDLLTGEEERRQRRLDQLAHELNGKEFTLRIGSDDDATAQPVD